jgi:hypothetical protein
MKKILITGLVNLLFASPVIAQNFTGKSGEAFVNRNGNLFRAGNGTVLVQGDEITTANKQYLYSIDFNAGTFFQFPNSTVDISVLNRFKGCSITQVIYSGKIGLEKVPFTCKFSSFTFINKKGGFYRSRNTQIILEEKEKSNVLIVENGETENEQNGEKVIVKSNQFNVTEEGENPGKAQDISYVLGLDFFSYRRVSTGIVVRLKTSPINKVRINYSEYKLFPSGELNVFIKYPILENQLIIELENFRSKKIIVKNLGYRNGR